MTAVEGERAAGPPIDDAAVPQQRADTGASPSGAAAALEPAGHEPAPAPGPAEAADDEPAPPQADPDRDEPAPVEQNRDQPAPAVGSAEEDPDREPASTDAASEEPPALPAPAEPRRRRGVVVAAVLLALLLTLGGGVAGAWAALTFRPEPPPPVPEPAPAPTGLLGAVDAVAPAVLRIQAGDPDTGTAGTALVVTPTGDVVTNAHLVYGEPTATVIYPDGRSGTARVVAADEEADLAWLRIDSAQGLPVVRLAGPAAVRPGEDVIAIGNALNLEGPPSITRGVVSAVGRSTSTLTDVIQTDAAISSGSSGGALVDRSGTVVGITTEALVGDPTVSVEDIAFAIPSDRVVTVLRGMGLDLSTVR